MLTRLFTIACLTRHLAAACLATVLAIGLASGAHANGIKRIIVFGDSLSDTGNLFDLTEFCAFTRLPPSPPYFDGRFSNGRLWVEYLAEMLGKPKVDNFSVGGAFTNTLNANQVACPEAANTGIENQVDAFLAAGGKIKRNHLGVLWAGANNYFGGETDPFIVVGDLVAAITRLATEGGVRRVLVVNLPKLGFTPAGQNSGFPNELNALSIAHNTILTAAVADLRVMLDIDIILFDVDSIFDQVLQNEAFGLDNSTLPCLVDFDFTVTGACLDFKGDLDSDKMDETLFWDVIHPTTAAHLQIAVAAFGALTSAVGAEVATATE